MKDLSCITDELKDLDPYELHRLSVWINNELRQTKVINNIRNTFQVGDIISWFNTRTNSEIDSRVEHKGRNYVTVRIPNGEIWEIAYHSINTKKLTPALPNNYNSKLTKNDFKVGENVEFISDGNHLNGSIIKLNSKTASVKIKEQPGVWRVSYCLLTKVIDSSFSSIIGELTC